jgi:4-hydroxy-tetrahydrodipicolinate synthase
MKMTGVLTPVVTPFDDALKPDADRLVHQCRWMLSQDVGLAMFGTNSEANSLSTGERRMLLDAVVEAGLPAERMMPGTGLCNLPESIELTRHAVERGVGGVLMLPPFYYKGVSDDGLFDHFARVIEGVGDDRLRIYLYHIPPVAQVGLSLELIERLLDAYPGIIAGIKDSSGDWNNTQAMIERFGDRGFAVFAGSEDFLLQTMRAGGAGCISATANINPAAIARLARDWQAEGADHAQAKLSATRAIVQGFPMIPALKATVARHSGDEGWARVRPPLVALTTGQREQLGAKLDAVGFTMPGLKEAATA